MKQSDDFRGNAENCAQLAERSTDGPTYKRYKRMEASWRALAEEQDWLDGEMPPTETKKPPGRGRLVVLGSGHEPRWRGRAMRSAAPIEPQHCSILQRHLLAPTRSAETSPIFCPGEDAPLDCPVPGVAFLAQVTIQLILRGFRH